jgi:hypothetical protein
MKNQARSQLSVVSGQLLGQLFFGQLQGWQAINGPIVINTAMVGTTDKRTTDPTTDH